MNTFHIVAILVSASALASCGGASNSSSDNELPAQYEGLAGLVEAAEAGNLAEASPSMMAGTATLAGALEVSDVGEDSGLNALGDLALTADFTEGSVTGSVTNVGLYDSDTQDLDTEMSGSLAVAGSITGASLMAGATGVLTDDEPHDVDLAMDGTFYDYDGGLAVYGAVTGTIDGQAEEGGFGAIAD